MEGPSRSFMDEGNIEWRHGGPPDYTLVNDQFMAEKLQSHKAGSLEEVVENLVKTWEMELSHKVNPKQWQTVDQDKFTFILNGTHKFNLEQAVTIGSYNMLMPDTPFYDNKQSLASSHDLFRTAFSGSFPWEVIDVLSGPPKVAFTWRHWGNWTGEYNGIAPTGERIEMRGMSVAEVTEDLKIISVDTYYDPNPFLLQFLSKREGVEKGGCPFHKK